MEEENFQSYRASAITGVTRVAGVMKPHVTLPQFS